MESLFKKEEESEEEKENIAIDIDFKPIEQPKKVKSSEAKVNLAKILDEYLEDSIDINQLSTLNPQIPCPISLESIDGNDREFKTKTEEKDANAVMLHIKLPKYVPMLDKETTIGSKYKKEEKIPDSQTKYVASSPTELPSGYLGKMKTYKNGTTTMEIGDTVYNVSEGAMSTSIEKFGCYLEQTEEFIFLGGCEKRLTLSVDVDQLLYPSGS